MFVDNRISPHEKRKLAWGTHEKCQQKPSGGQKVEEHFPTNKNETKKKKKSIYSQRTLGSEWSLELDKGIQETL